MLAADQASKETFCKLGNQFIKYAEQYIEECGAKSNLGMQGSSGMMVNNIKIIKEKCQDYTETVSDNAPATSSQLSTAEYAELQTLRAEKAEKEKMARELVRLKAEKEQQERTAIIDTSLVINANNTNRRAKNYPYVCYDGKMLSSGQAI